MFVGLGVAIPWLGVKGTASQLSQSGTHMLQRARLVKYLPSAASDDGLRQADQKSSVLQAVYS